MGPSARFLIIDGYHKAGRDELAAGGASAAGDLYSRMLQKCLPGAACEPLIHKALSERFPHALSGDAGRRLRPREHEHARGVG